MNNVYLVGSETVERAASSMRDSAGQISRAASTFQSAVEMLARVLDDHATRIEAAGESLTTALSGAQGDPLTLLDRFALAAVPALISMRREATTFREDTSDAYTFAEIALEVRSELNTRRELRDIRDDLSATPTTRVEAEPRESLVVYDSERWTDGRGGLKFIGETWTFEDSLFAHRTFRPEDINAVVPCGPEPDSCDGADDAPHQCRFHAIAHGAMDLDDVETPAEAAPVIVRCERTPYCYLGEHDADVPCEEPPF